MWKRNYGNRFACLFEMCFENHLLQDFLSYFQNCQSGRRLVNQWANWNNRSTLWFVYWLAYLPFELKFFFCFINQEIKMCCNCMIFYSFASSRGIFKTITSLKESFWLLNKQTFKLVMPSSKCYICKAKCGTDL